jgi:transposase
LPLKKRGGHKAPKLSEVDFEIIQSIVDPDVTLTTKEIRARFMEKTGKVFSLETIRKSLRKYDFSFKRVYPLGNPANLQQNSQDGLSTEIWGMT